MPFLEPQIIDAFQKFPDTYFAHRNTYLKNTVNRNNLSASLGEVLRNFAEGYPNLSHGARDWSRTNGIKTLIKIGICNGDFDENGSILIYDKNEYGELYIRGNGNEELLRKWSQISQSIKDFAAELDARDSRHPSFFPITDPGRTRPQGSSVVPVVVAGGEQEKMSATIPKNVILFGPPGTGKTFATTSLAVFCATSDVFDPGKLQVPPSLDTQKAYNKLVSDGRIRFVTFHQSYSYEDFVEGLSATADDGKIEYFQKPGAFKKIAAAALCDWLNNHKQGSCTSLTTACEDKPSRLKQIFAEAQRAVLTPDQEAPVPAPPAPVTEADPNRGERPATESQSGKSAPSNYVLIIDEINRGNVAKIFGELITLIEDSKRARGPGERQNEHQPTGVTLPLSGDPFYVPSNLYIIGTMNTADRSLVGMDMAMRRRFEFIELLPRPDKLNGQIVDGLNLGNFLAELNRRICENDSSDHQIGHAYLLGVNDLPALVRVMKNKIIPQLRENMIGRESELQSMLSRDGQSLVDRHGRPNEDNLENTSYYPGYAAANGNDA